MKTYTVPQHNEAAVHSMMAGAVVPRVVANMLLNRGISTAHDARRFINGDPGQAHHLHGADLAADWIMEHIESEREIAIFGDYDCDGVCSTAILHRTIKALGGNVSAYLPERADGYGLSGHAAMQMHFAGADLVVTVDCGIRSIEAADTLRIVGTNLIVTDHHEPGPELPDAMIVHPRLPNREAFSGGDICGAGVALHIAGELLSQGRSVSLAISNSLHALAAIATVADVVPLTGENRDIVRNGLTALNNSISLIPGLPSLIVACCKPGIFTAQDLAFSICPAINAAGRMSSPMAALNLLLSDDENACHTMAGDLYHHNAARKTDEKEAIKNLTFDADAPAIVVCGTWNPGLSGIIAGRLAEKHGKPVLAISDGKGSGRSRQGLPLHELLAECGDLLISHGGHAAAAGFAIDPTKLDAFRDRFCAAVFRRGAAVAESVTVDAEVRLHELSLDLVRQMDALAPFGAGNPEPLLSTHITRIREIKNIGSDKSHVSFTAEDEGFNVRCVYFGGAERMKSFTHRNDALIFTPQISNYGSQPKVELRIREVL